MTLLNSENGASLHLLSHVSLTRNALTAQTVHSNPYLDGCHEFEYSDQPRLSGGIELSQQAQLVFGGDASALGAGSNLRVVAP